MNTLSCKSITSSTWGCKRKCTTMNRSRRARKFYLIKRKPLPLRLLTLSITSKTTLLIKLNKQLNQSHNLKNHPKPSHRSLKSLLKGLMQVTTTRSAAWSTNRKWRKAKERGWVKSPRIGIISSGSSSTIYSRWHSRKNKRRRCSKR